MERPRNALARWWRERRSSELFLEDADVLEPDDVEALVAELAHERDVSIARATEAEERERLVRERLGSLTSLERRVEDAERRALDAERRLDEIEERVEERDRDDH